MSKEVSQCCSADIEWQPGKKDFLTDDRAVTHTAHCTNCGEGCATYYTNEVDMDTFVNMALGKDYETLVRTLREGNIVWNENEWKQFMEKVKENIADTSELEETDDQQLIHENLKDIYGDIDDTSETVDKHHPSWVEKAERDTVAWKIIKKQQEIIEKLEDITKRIN
jgi:hypothetical protein